MTILDTLADHARARTERNKGRVSFDEMKMLALSMNADTGYPFEKALGAPGISFICEVKNSRICRLRGSTRRRAPRPFPA